MSEKGNSGFQFNIPDVGNIDMGKVSPMLGVPGAKKGGREPDFIDTNFGGQASSSLRFFYEMGLWWLLGYGYGGILGIKEGWSGAAHANWRLRVNGIMNGMSKTGGRLSNLFAIVALAHTGLIWGCDYLQIDTRANNRLATPATAGMILGGSYYIFNHGIRGPHLARAGIAMVAGSALSIGYLIGRPMAFNLFSLKKNASF